MKIYLRIGGLLWCLAHFNVDAGQRNNETCGIEPGKPLTNGYGPYDFTNPSHKPNLPIVLGTHFKPEVEHLIKGTNGVLPGDIDYTLRAIPNYHRALNAMSKFEIKGKIKRKSFDEFYTAECYFKRAIYFQPKDAVTRMIYGIHQHKLANYSEAESLYLQALSMSPQSPEIHYNLGLLYVDISELDKASMHAEKAYSGGYPLPGLKNRIARAREHQ